ncbi:MAG TPA: BTAD domain-containing putative transcriptional regulator [Longimicrobiales bacterium]
MWQLTLFGGFDVEGANSLTGRAAQRKRQAVLALLGSGSHAQMSRDKLVGLLWPETDDERARRQLASSIYDLRQVLGDDAILATGDDLRLNPERIRSDVREFDAAFERGDLEAATSLRTGTFLDGFHVAGAPEFERWVDGERDRLDQRYTRAIEKLAEQCSAAGDHQGAARWLQQLATQQPYNSHVALLYMRALDRAGDTAGAIRHARTHELLTQQEFGVAADEQLAEFVAELRARPPAAKRNVDAAVTRESVTDEIEPPSLGERLKQRKILQWTAAYVAAAWVILQVVGVLAQGFDWATPLLRILVVLLAAGVPVVLTLAWYHGERGRQSVNAVEIAILLLLLVTATATTRLTVGSRGTPAPLAMASIAVLPLDNLSGGEEDEALRGGITEEIISQLAQVTGLHVISRQSASVLKGRGMTVRQIADTLRVRHVLEGSVQRAGDRVRVTVQLIDAHTDTHVWSHTYTEELVDLFQVQEDIAATVRERIVATLDTTRLPAPPRAGNNQAYAAYLRGMHWKKLRTPTALEASITEFKSALQSDSSFAPAYAGLAAAYVHRAGWGDDRRSFEDLARARRLADAAIVRDPRLAEGYAARGLAVLRATGEGARAEVDLRRALELRPGSAEFRNWYAIALNYQGRSADAITHLRYATQLDPIEPTVHGSLAQTAFPGRQYALAIEERKAAVELFATSGRLPPPALAAINEYSALLQGRPQDCLRTQEQVYPAVEAACLLALGRSAEAQVAARTAEAALDTATVHVGYHLLANYYAYAGDVDGTLRILRKGVALTPFMLDPRFRHSALYDRIRNDARYQDGIRAIEAAVRARSDQALRAAEASYGKADR